MTTGPQGFNALAISKLVQYGAVGQQGGNLTFTRANGIDPAMSKRISGYGGPPHIYTEENFTPESAGAAAPRMRIFVQSDKSAAIAAGSLDRVSTCNEALARLASDLNLNPTGKQASRVPIASTAITALGRDWAALQTIKATLDAQEQQLFGVPAADAAAAPIDAYVLDTVDEMTAADRVQLFNNLQDPKNARVLLALSRGPFPFKDAEAEAISVAWAAQVRQAQPDAVDGYTNARELNDWADGLVRFLISTIAGNVNLDPVALYKLLKPVGAVDAYPWAVGQVGAIEARIARDAAVTAAAA
jgi:hypothetical protein